MAKYVVSDIWVSPKKDCITYWYGGKMYNCTGEFHIDKDGYLHHSHITKRGKEIEFKVYVGD